MDSHRNIIDIIMTTRNRVEYLRQSVTRLMECTRYPYALHIIDDQSTDNQETRKYLLHLLDDGKLATVVFRHDRGGIMANKNLAPWLAFSDPFVVVDDDILCPDLEPCWLERAVAAMGARPKLAILALNHPGAFRLVHHRDDQVVYCEAVGGTFRLTRRAFAEKAPLPHYRRNYGVIDELLICGKARETGWQVGFLQYIYCYHIGINSAATPERQYPEGIPVRNWKTLEPMTIEDLNRLPMIGPIND